MSNTTTLPRLLTAEEVARSTGIPLARIYELSRNGAMPAVRLGRAVRFSEAALLAWIEAGGTSDTHDGIGCRGATAAGAT